MMNGETVNKLRVFLADDHAVIREGLKSLIRSQTDMTVIGEANNGRSALNQAVKLRPDVVVMDISMPELNGILVTERLKEQCPATKVLVLTVHEDKAYVQHMLKCGVSGYILKRAVVEELVSAIRTVATGNIYLDSSLAAKVLGTYSHKQASNERMAHDELSARETQVLQLTAWGYCNKEIANKLTISTRTVETYKSRLMDKLGFRSRVDIVRYAIDRGWMPEPGDRLN
jgi:DNA-binding NarL/FixJ family response regulator